MVPSVKRSAAGDIGASPASDEVGLWRISLRDSPPDSDCLSGDECERAARFRFERDRNRFVRARTALRTILAGCLSCAAHDVAFAYSPHGKPRLDPARHGDLLRFNISHAEDLLLVVTISGREIGVDVERIRPMPDWQDIAARFFAPTEIEALSGAPDPDRAFFACWTRKEACVKAWGGGLSLQLDRFVVAAGPIGNPEIAPANLAYDDSLAPLLLLDLPAGTAYAAAVAIEGTDIPAVSWRSSANPLCVIGSAREL